MKTFSFKLYKSEHNSKLHSITYWNTARKQSKTLPRELIGLLNCFSQMLSAKCVARRRNLKKFVGINRSR